MLGEAATHSRAASAATGMALVLEVNRMRINFACRLLMGAAGLPITGICYAAGYNNLSHQPRAPLAHQGIRAFAIPGPM
ncbi:MAG: hypothetical protein H0T75_05280 [Rhizobiales bacterium]|nr:hypothetical protein [Hyphomicrobiales bacterium]MDQ3557951.1 helix-turn-helix domain-containing protein [Pseudomonadota bacterium]